MANMITTNKNNNTTVDNNNNNNNSKGENQDGSVTATDGEVELEKMTLSSRLVLSAGLMASESAVAFEQLYVVPNLQTLGMPVRYSTLSTLFSGAIATTFVPLLGYFSDRGSNPRKRRTWLLALSGATLATGMLVICAANILHLNRYSANMPTSSGNKTQYPNEDITAEALFLYNNVTDSTAYAIGATLDNITGSIPYHGKQGASSGAITGSTPSDTGEAGSDGDDVAGRIPYVAIMAMVGYVLLDAGYDCVLSGFKAWMLVCSPASQATPTLVAGLVMASLGGMTQTGLGMVDLASIVGSASSDQVGLSLQTSIQAAVAAVVVVVGVTSSLLMGNRQLKTRNPTCPQVATPNEVVSSAGDDTAALIPGQCTKRSVCYCDSTVDSRLERQLVDKPTQPTAQYGSIPQTGVRHSDRRPTHACVVGAKADIHKHGAVGLDGNTSGGLNHEFAGGRDHLSDSGLFCRRLPPVKTAGVLPSKPTPYDCGRIPPGAHFPAVKSAIALAYNAGAIPLESSLSSVETSLSLAHNDITRLLRTSSHPTGPPSSTTSLVDRGPAGEDDPSARLIPAVKTDSPRSCSWLPRCARGFKATLGILCGSTYFSTGALSMYMLGSSDYVGKAIYGGDPEAPVGSDSLSRYQKGVSITAYGFLVNYISYFSCSFAQQRIMNVTGYKVCYTAVQVLMGVSFVAVALTARLEVFFVLCVAGGLQRAVFHVVPFAVVSNAVNAQAHTQGAGSSKTSRMGLGLAVSVVGASMPLAICSLFPGVGPLQELTGLVAVPLFLGSVCCFLSAFLFQLLHI